MYCMCVCICGDHGRNPRTSVEDETVFSHCLHSFFSALSHVLLFVFFFSSPRDEIARVSDIAVHERGGVIVDDKLRTNDEDIYAIGEVALHG